MKYNTATLSNALRVIHLPSTSPVVYCGYQIRVGSRNEGPGEEGLAHFCEHATFKGTEHRRAWNVMNHLESVGGDLNAFTTKDHTVYHAAVLKQHVARAIDILSDMVFHSTYPQTELDKEVEVICDEIESYNDSPAELIYDDFENIIFKGHPLGHAILGTAENVRSFTSETARAFTRKYYRPDNAIFFVYGDVDFKKVLRSLAATLAAKADGSRHSQDMPMPQEDSSLLHGTATALPAGPAPSSPARETEGERPEGLGEATIRIAKGTHQAHVMLGTRAYNIHDDRRMSLYLLNNMLGGPGMNARLNLVLREHHGLVYTVESSMVSYGDTGMWSIYFGCDPHDVKRCLRLVRRELDRFMREPISPTRLNAAKKQIKGQIGVACDSRENFALDFGKSFLHYGWEKDVEALFRNIDAITAEGIHEVARELFAPERLTTLIYQ